MKKNNKERGRDMLLLYTRGFLFLLLCLFLQTLLSFRVPHFIKFLTLHLSPPNFSLSPLFVGSLLYPRTYYYFFYNQQPHSYRLSFSLSVAVFLLLFFSRILSMAEDLDYGEFWLPSEFLADDMFMGTNKNKNKMSSKGEESESRAVCFPTEFPYGLGSYGSALSSPVESVVGSTETESDEEDYMAGLTRQIAHTMLLDDDKLPLPALGKKGVVAGSPQSTLCAVGSWSGCSHGSSCGSSNGPSQMSSPPSTPMFQKDDDAWELLSAAAGQVVRIKMNDEALKFHGRGLLGPPRKLPSTAPVPVKTASAGFYPNQALTYEQVQKNQFQQLKQQQCPAAWGRQRKLTPPVQQQEFCAGTFGNGRSGRTLGLSSSAWPPLQQQQQHQRQQPSAGMRAVFLGGPGSRRESGGTGVFLPRRAGNPADTRKKAACPTMVLLPARVVQALNLNIDEMGTPHPRFQGSLHHDHEAMAAGSNALHSQQKLHTIRPQTTLTNHEIRLPQEWTY